MRNRRSTEPLNDVIQHGSDIPGVEMMFINEPATQLLQRLKLKRIESKLAASRLIEAC